VTGAGQAAGPLAGAVTGGAAASTVSADTGATGPRVAVTADGAAAGSTADRSGVQPAAAAGRAQEPPRARPDTATAARVFDAATTRRPSVVFEEDHELDVPDFLK
jgi:hypothetical protein